MLMVWIGKTIVGIIDDNPIVLEVSVSFFYIIPLSIGFMGMMQIASSCFNALGKPTPSLVISILRALVIGVPLAVLGNYLYGYVGIFIATAITNVGRRAAGLAMELARGQPAERGLTTVFASLPTGRRKGVI